MEAWDMPRQMPHNAILLMLVAPCLGGHVEKNFAILFQILPDTFVVVLFSCKLFFTAFAVGQCLSNELVDFFQVLFGQPVSVHAENTRYAVVVCLRQPTLHCSAACRRITRSCVEHHFPAEIVVDGINQVRFQHEIQKKITLTAHANSKICIGCLNTVPSELLDIPDVVRPCIEGWQEISRCVKHFLQ
jgi:hypothetical protein